MTATSKAPPSVVPALSAVFPLVILTRYGSFAAGDLPSSEANAVIANFNALTEPQKQDIFSFLRGL